MAQNSGLSVENCLMCKTEKPFSDVRRRSPSFSFWGSDWYFSFTFFCGRRSYYTLKLLQKEKKMPSKKVSSAVFLKEESSFIESNWIEQITGEREMICFDNTSDIGLWTIYCVFLSDSPIELHVNRSETMCLSNLSDLNLNREQNSNQSSIFMKAKLAACTPYDLPSGSAGLSYDLSKLLEHKSYSDVTLNCGDMTFSAHRSILSARSEVFATMFQNQMVENETGVVDITDIDGDVFNLLLQYVYSEKVSDLNVDCAPSLYVAADKYAIHNLKAECSKWMLVNLTTDNCLDFLVLADSCSDELFKDRLIAFIGEILDLLEGQSWLKFTEEYPKLAITVLQMRAFSK